MTLWGLWYQSASKHKYILVVVDYATRYLEAMPLRNIWMEAVARKLALIFSQVGFPKQVLTDQSTSFRGDTMKAKWRYVVVQPLHTSVYHPQTNQLVECFNGPLEKMLRKFLSKNGKDWPQWLPFLLFAVTEAPQASIGYSSFELL